MVHADSTTARKTRRGTAEIRRLVLSAAHDLFATQGYHGTKTREIAERAGVAEPVIFRNFGSKAELFKIAVVGPFSTFIEQWAQDWRAEPLMLADPESITRSYVEGFYGLVEEHRELLVTLFAARVKGGDELLAEVSDAVVEHFTSSLTVMRDLLLDHGGVRDWRGVDSPVTVAVAIGAVMSILMLDDWIYVRGEPRPSREREMEEITQLLLHGVAHRGSSNA